MNLGFPKLTRDRSELADSRPHGLESLAALAGGVDAFVRTCLGRIAVGEAAALVRLYDHLGSFLFGLARHITGDDVEAEDIVHDVFLIAWNRPVELGARPSPAAWLTREVRNKSVDRADANRRRSRIPLYDPEKPETVATTVAEADGPVSKPRRAVELAFFHGLTVQEISALLDEPIPTIQSRIKLELDQLRPGMKAVGVLAKPPAKQISSQTTSPSGGNAAP